MFPLDPVLYDAGMANTETTQNAPSLDAAPRGILLLHTGSPDTCDTGAVRRYLRKFLMDPYVLDMPWPLRAMLVHCVILPLRPRKSAAAYRAIWTGGGSPLVVNTEALRAALEEALPGTVVRVASAYGHPSIPEGLDALAACGAGETAVLPLFPQYAGATRGGVTSVLFREAATRWNVPSLSIVPPFYAHPAFIGALAEIWGPMLADFAPDRVLFSFHGLPLRQVRKGVAGGLAYDYERQCRMTMEGIAGRLGLDPARCVLGWQSRFGKGWLEPATDDLLAGFPGRGAKRVAVCAPSFVGDCLETLEELGIRGKEAFLQAGGGDFMLLPSPNSHPAWVRAVVELLR